MKKIKLVTVVGTRPELIRLSVIINKCDQFFEHVLIHTGQNYDFELNEIFFKELNIRKPDYFLEVVGDNLGETLGNVISKSYSIFSEVKPDALLVLGDTNSSLSIISAKRLKIPIFHMEAGNRCFDQNVPEEINRKVADHLADINLTYTENSRRYLLAEGFRKDFVFTTGSPLKEVLQTYAAQIEKSEILSKLKIKEGKYIVASIHREENLDIKDNFKNIISGVSKVSKLYGFPVIFSTHPRTRKKIESLNINIDSIQFIKPLGFFDYVQLQSKALITLSDSGTISEESAMMGFPAVSVRTSTERPEAIDYGSIVLGNIDEYSIVQSVEIAIGTFATEKMQTPIQYQALDVSSRIIRIIQSYTTVVKREIWKQ